MSPAFAEYFDAELFETAAEKGRTYEFYDTAAKSIKPTSVVIIGFDDFSDRKRTKNIKKVLKLVDRRDDIQATTTNSNNADEIIAALDVTYYTVLPDHADSAAPKHIWRFLHPNRAPRRFHWWLASTGKKPTYQFTLAGHVTTTLTVFTHR